MSEIADMFLPMPSDLVFTALAHPVRRQVLELLTEGPCTAGALASRFELSRPAVSEHLQILRRAELVRDTPKGRERHYELAPESLNELSRWLAPFERYWRGRLGALTEVLDALPDEPPKKKRRRKT